MRRHSHAGPRLLRFQSRRIQAGGLSSPGQGLRVAGRGLVWLLFSFACCGLWVSFWIFICKFGRWGGCMEAPPLWLLSWLLLSWVPSRARIRKRHTPKKNLYTVFPLSGSDTDYHSGLKRSGCRVRG